MSAPFASGLSVGVCTVTSFRHKEKTFSFTLHSKFALCLIQTAQVTLKKNFTIKCHGHSHREVPFDEQCTCDL